MKQNLLATKALFLSGLMLGVAIPLHAADNLIANGSFEISSTPFDDAADLTIPSTLNGYQELAVGDTSLTGWTVVGNNIFRGRPAAENANGFAPSDGSYWLDLTGYFTGVNGAVTQDISTTTGLTYHLAFDLGVYPEQFGLEGPITVAATAGGSTMDFIHGPSGSGTQWANYGFDFVATGSSTTITIQGVSANAVIGLDNVSVMAVVPEPSSYALAGAGLLAFAVWRRRHLSQRASR